MLCNTCHTTHGSKSKAHPNLYRLHADEALAVANGKHQVILDDAEVTESVRRAARELDLGPPIVVLQAHHSVSAAVERCASNVSGSISACAMQVTLIFRSSQAARPNLVSTYQQSCNTQTQESLSTMEGLCSFRAATQRSRSSGCFGKIATPEKYTSCRPGFCSRVVPCLCRAAYEVACMVTNTTCVCVTKLWQQFNSCHLAGDLIAPQRLLNALDAVQLTTNYLQDTQRPVSVEQLAEATALGRQHCVLLGPCEAALDPRGSPRRLLLWSTGLATQCPVTSLRPAASTAGNINSELPSQRARSTAITPC